MMLRALLIILLTQTALAGDEVLDRFLGRWKTDVVILRGASRIEASGLAQGVRSLEGRYVEFRGQSLEPPGESDLQVMTYDAASDLYHQWLFDSSGYRHQASGRWDASTETLTWEGTLGPNRLVIRDRFRGDRLEWELEETAPDGTVVRTIEGVLRR